MNVAGCGSLQERSNVRCQSRLWHPVSQEVQAMEQDTLLEEAKEQREMSNMNMICHDAPEVLPASVPHKETKASVGASAQVMQCMEQDALLEEEREQCEVSNMNMAGRGTLEK